MTTTLERPTTTSVPLDHEGASSTPDTARKAALASGLGGLGFVAVVVIGNILRSAEPLMGAPVADITAYYRDQRILASLAGSGFVLGLPCLLLFAHGLRRVLNGNAAAGAGVGGLYALVASFSLVVTTDVTLNTLIASGSGDPTAVAIVWTLHSAAFVLNGAVLGSALLLMATGAGRGNVLPRWIRPLGIVGGLLLLIGCIPVVPAMEGSPIALAGLAGFLVWLVWATAASISLIRNR